MVDPDAEDRHDLPRGAGHLGGLAACSARTRRGSSRAARAVVAALYGLGSITFITAVYNTSTANLVFILAFTTMFAALLSWVFLKERPRPRRCSPWR